MPAGTPCWGPLLTLSSSLTSSSPVHSSLVPPPLLLLLEHIKPVPATGSLHLMGLPPGLLGFNPSFHLVLSQLQPHWEVFSSCYLKCHSPTPVTFCPFSSLAFLCSTYDHLIYYIHLFTSHNKYNHFTQEVIDQRLSFTLLIWFGFDLGLTNNSALDILLKWNLLLFIFSSY